MDKDNQNNKNNISRKRQVAHLVRIKQLLTGTYVREEGWIPNYVLVDDRRKISRVNLLCSVVSKDDAADTKSIVVDDGSGTISLRTFDDANPFSELIVGSTMMVIGRPREYGTEKYIIPEIIKKINNPKWVSVRQKELELLSLSIQKIIPQQEEEQAPAESVKEDEDTAVDKDVAVSEEITYIDENEQEQAREKTPAEILCEMIKELDSGDGVDVQELIEKLSGEKTEQLITDMMTDGNIFEIRAGRVKLL